VATFISCLNIIPVQTQRVENGTIIVEMLMNISGQAYVLLTKDMSGSITDSTVLVGPAIIEVTPGSPTFDLKVM
jgi:hypothetical protein